MLLGFDWANDILVLFLAVAAAADAFDRLDNKYVNNKSMQKAAITKNLECTHRWKGAFMLLYSMWIDAHAGGSNNCRRRQLLKQQQQPSSAPYNAMMTTGGCFRPVPVTSISPLLSNGLALWNAQRF